MTTQALQRIPIPGPDNPDRIYLQLVPNYDREMVIIEPGPSADRLPDFWPVWVRQLILHHSGRSVTINVELSGNRVVVSSPNGFDKALAVATTAASKVYHVPKYPLARHDFHFRGETGVMRWAVRYDPSGDLSEQEVLEQVSQQLGTWAKQIRLPGNAKVYPEPTSIRGMRVRAGLTLVRGNAIPSLSELAQIVEMHISLKAAGINIP